MTEVRGICDVALHFPFQNEGVADENDHGCDRHDGEGSLTVFVQDRRHSNKSQERPVLQAVHYHLPSGIFW